MKQAIVIHWFRRDLRLVDNTALAEACASGLAVLPIFIFDPDILEELPRDDARVSFIHQSLTSLKEKIQAQEGSLALYLGKPQDVFTQLLENFQVQAVFYNKDYEPYAMDRDAAVRSLLQDQGVSFYGYKDQVIFEEDQVVKADGKPYTVYTPYMRKWREAFKLEPQRPSPQALNNWAQVDRPWMSLEAIGFQPSSIHVPKAKIAAHHLKGYAHNRDFPAMDATSHLSTHLRFGTVSIRTCVAHAIEQNNEPFLKELIWREFFMQILWHFPRTTTKSFKPLYDQIAWRNDPAEFECWKTGQTGYPMVDAGMRELNATGLMHNRVRMVVASFLCKHLLIDWRWGEAYFASKLLDFEQSSNVGNWQWAAGSGCDAAPYFRIFNPTSQFQKFDPKAQYVSKWVPEWQKATYSPPMVDHKMARIRCLETYQAAVKKG